MYKYGQKLPKNVEKQLDEYIKRIKNIKWFQPSKDLDKNKIEQQVSFALETFGLKANVEYKKLSSPQDWGTARDAALDAAWDTSRNAALGAAWGASRDAAWGASRDAAWGAAWDDAFGVAGGAAFGVAWDDAFGAAWDATLGVAGGAADVLALNLDTYKEKYPNGNFINLIPLWEMGLYPVGIINKKFVIYVPTVPQEFPDFMKELKGE